MFLVAIGDKAERRKNRYLDERETHPGRSEEEFGHPEGRYMRHDKAYDANETQCHQHASLVADSCDERGNQEDVIAIGRSLNASRILAADSLTS